MREAESARGLAFVRRPTLERIPAADASFEALRASSTPLFVREGLIRLELVTGAAPDAARDRIVALEEAPEQDLRIALGALLDAQHHPELARLAPDASGDPGLTLRALVAASALATAQGGLGPTPDEPPVDPLGGPTFDIPEPVSPEVFLRTPLLAAMGFLRSLRDRERAFVAPPLATLLLLRPALYPGTLPLVLDGGAAAGPGCLVARDESVGAFRLARTVVARGGSVPAAAIGGWRGDRLVEETCLGDRGAWRYVVLLEDADAAAEFASAAESLLPEELSRPFAVERTGDRVVAVHGGSRSAARAWAESLEPRPLASLQGLGSDESRTR